jgi:uncharacterized protein
VSRTGRRRPQGSIDVINITRVVFLPNLYPGKFIRSEREILLTATCTAFVGLRQLASGPPLHVALAVKAVLGRDAGHSVLVFDDATGGLIDFDLRGTPAEIAARIEQPKPKRLDEPTRGPGRPKLGVVAREVTLLPRHWDWLNAQPGGASAALRKLVDAARGTHAQFERRRLAQQSTDRFILAMAGDEPGYEEAARALYSGDRARFEACIGGWAPDVRRHALELAAAAFNASDAQRRTDVARDGLSQRGP